MCSLTAWSYLIWSYTSQVEFAKNQTEDPDRERSGGPVVVLYFSTKLAHFDD